MENLTNVTNIKSAGAVAVEVNSYYKNKKYFYGFVKRFFDICLSSVAIVVLIPFFLIIAAAIKIDDPKGAVFYASKRVGKGGKIIKILKFRSMVHNADEVFENFTPEQKEEYYKAFKLKNDPRITRVGKFLRKTSLDELPQLFNIFRGELSIIGWRPILEEEPERYGDRISELLSVKPGLTGYWAVNGRSNTDYSERMRLELYYVEHRGFWLDIKIFFKTVISVFKGDGAD